MRQSCDIQSSYVHAYARVSLSRRRTVVSTAHRACSDYFRRLSICSYPFTLSKTALTAVGSPTTYPAVLAALAWLAELLTYDAAALEPDAQLGATSLDAHDALDAAAAASAGGGAEAAFFFASVRAAYEHFLAGEDDAAAAVDARVAAAFAARHAALEGESARLREANAALREEIAAAKSGASALPGLRGTQAALAAEVDGARRAIGGLEATRDGLNAQLLAAQRTLRDRGACRRPRRPCMNALAAAIPHHPRTIDCYRPSHIVDCHRTHDSTSISPLSSPCRGGGRGFGVHPGSSNSHSRFTGPDTC